MLGFFMYKQMNTKTAEYAKVTYTDFNRMVNEDLLTEAQILSDVWDQEPDIRATTSEWVYSFLMLAYDPVTDEELATYTAFSTTPAGKQLNTTLFAAFDGFFDGISRELGYEAARMMTGAEL